MSTHEEDTTWHESSARLALLVWGVVGGSGFGAITLGTVAFLGADNSDLFSPEEQAMYGTFFGAIGGALAGLLLWTAVVVTGLCYGLLRRAFGRRQ